MSQVTPPSFLSTGHATPWVSASKHCRQPGQRPTLRTVPNSVGADRRPPLRSPPLRSGRCAVEASHCRPARPRRARDSLSHWERVRVRVPCRMPGYRRPSPLPLPKGEGGRWRLRPPAGRRSLPRAQRRGGRPLRTHGGPTEPALSAAKGRSAPTTGWDDYARFSGAPVAPRGVDCISC